MYNVFPDLDYFFTQYWNTYGEITTDYISVTDMTPLENPDYKAVFRLLFDNSFNEDEYRYLFATISPTDLPIAFKERLCTINQDNMNIWRPICGEINWNCWPPDSTNCVGQPGRSIMLGISGADVQYVECCDNGPITGVADISHNDATGVIITESNNPWNFAEIDIQMFDMLHQYRLGNIPDLTSVDTSFLTTKMSKMVYSYLDLMLNLNFDPFFNDSSVFSTPGNTLETLYEVYLMNEAHRTIKNWNFLIDSGVVITRPWRDKSALAVDQVTRRRLRLCYEPSENTDMVVLLNGKVLGDTSYRVVTDSTGMDSTSFTDGTCASGYAIEISESVDIAVGDYVLIDYYTEEALVVDPNCDTCYRDSDEDTRACVRGDDHV